MAFNNFSGRGGYAGRGRGGYGGPRGGSYQAQRGGVVGVGSLAAGWGVCFRCGRPGHPAALCEWNQAAVQHSDGAVGVPSAVCACCGQQGHGRRTCPHHMGAKGKRNSCCVGGLGTQPQGSVRVVQEDGTQGFVRPVVNLPRPQAQQPGSVSATAGSQIMLLSRAVPAGPGVGVMVTAMWAFTLDSTLGKSTKTPAGSYMAVNLEPGSEAAVARSENSGVAPAGWRVGKPAGFDRLSELVGRYDSVTFASAFVEILAPGSVGAGCVWAVVVRDTATEERKIAEIEGSERVVQSTTASTVLEVDFSRYSRHVVVSRRNRPGPKLRLWWNANDFIVRIHCAMWCVGEA